MEKPMKKISLLLTICFMIGYILPSLGQSNFNTSLHKTRNGKPTFYNAANGGFENFTGVPITELGCVECHDANDANGNPYPPTGYSPDCKDCHATLTNYAVTQGDCLGCHGRESAIINMGKPDVHRTAGKVCMDCHKKEELHGDDGVEHASLFDTGAITTDCSNTGCHAGFTHPGGQDPHNGKLHCSSCHAQSNLACYSCHFESQVQSHKKRPQRQITGFIFLVNRTKDNKVHPATFQSITYEGKAGVVFAPSVAHTIVKTGARTCTDCHQNYGGNIPAISDWNADGIIKFATWNTADSTLSWHQGIVPITPDFSRSLKMDYLTYNGNPDDPIAPSKNWSIVSENANLYQIEYCTPLTAAQMDAIGMNSSLLNVEKQIDAVPQGFKLEQNYPNPFNPTTTIRYSIPERAEVELIVYDALGHEIKTLVSGDHDAGVYEVEFDATGLTSGVYFYQIKTASFNETRKFVLMK
jgi:hypothetical protein